MCLNNSRCENLSDFGEVKRTTEKNFQGMDDSVVRYHATNVSQKKIEVHEQSAW